MRDCGGYRCTLFVGCSFHIGLEGVLLLEKYRRNRRNPKFSQQTSNLSRGSAFARKLSHVSFVDVNSKVSLNFLRLNSPRKWYVQYTLSWRKSSLGGIRKVSGWIGPYSVWFMYTKVVCIYYLGFRKWKCISVRRDIEWRWCDRGITVSPWRPIKRREEDWIWGWRFGEDKVPSDWVLSSLFLYCCCL